MILPFKPKCLSYKIDDIFAEHNHNIVVPLVLRRRISFNEGEVVCPD
jgi:hypothetical protein